MNDTDADDDNNNEEEEEDDDDDDNTISTFLFGMFLFYHSVLAS